MPALRAWISRFSLLLCVLLSACDRHNDISDPDPLLDDEKVTCEWKSLFDLRVPYVDGVRIDDTYEDQRFSMPFSFSPDLFEYEINTGFMVNSVRISVDDEAVVSEFPDELASLIIEINGRQMDTDEAVVIPLAVGVSSVDMDVSVTRIEELITEDEETCDYPSQREIDQALARGDPAPIPTRNVEDKLQYSFGINRQSLEVMQSAATLVNSASFAALDAHDEFGSQVLMSKIITDRNSGVTRDIMVVGVPQEDSRSQGIVQAADLTTEAQDNAAPDSGAVFIYERNSGGGWTLSHYLKASNAEAGDRFGSALAFHDNLLVVSALGEDSSSSGINQPMDNNLAPESGAVYVFEYDQNNWHQTNFVKTPVNSVGIDGFDDDYGFALSFDHGWLLVSAPKEDSSDGEGGNVNLPNSGSVYLYAVTQGEDDFQTFDYVQSFKAINPNRDDHFGRSVAMAPGGALFAVGSAEEDSNYRGRLELQDVGSESPELVYLNNNDAIDSGAVYLFRLEAQDRWSEDPRVYLKSLNSDPGDHFGAAMRFVDDDTLLVSAPLEDSNGDGLNSNPDSNSAPDSGAAYLYVLNEDDFWIERHFIKAPESEADQFFGSALTNYEGSFVISAPKAQNVPGKFNGAVYGYLFDQERVFNQQLTHFLSLPAEDTGDSTTDERFGSTVSLFGTTLAVASPGLTHGSGETALQQAGGVFIFQ